tara:strand:- start:260 stop:454 length:195 start_codon:yes stop_codon:yes gene_type:complete
MLKWFGNKLKKMKNDSLTINQNDDGSFTCEWDKNDPTWKFLNNMTSKEIEIFIEQAIKSDNSIK